MFEIFYVNSSGERLDLTSGNYRIQTGDIFDFSRDYITYGSRVKRFSMQMCVKEILLSIVASSSAKFAEAVNRFHDVTGYDVANNVPGKLYVWDWYIECYLISSKKEEWESGIECIDNTIELLAPNPYWTKEIAYEFKASGISSTQNKRYPNRYPYRYANGLSNASVINPHYDECNVLIRMYGEAISPIVYIGGHRYWINTVLEEGEYLEIDSRKRTVIKMMNSGIRVSEFNSRDRAENPFAKVQPGLNDIRFSGKIDFDIVLFIEKEEPEWQ